MGNAVGYIGWGTVLSYASNNAIYTNLGGFTDVAQCMDVPFPDLETDDVKMTHLKSPDAAHEYQPGLIEPGMVEFKILYQGSVLAAILSILRAPTTWRMTLPDFATQGSTLTYNGYLKGLTGEEKLDDNIISTAKIKITGLPKFVVGH